MTTPIMTPDDERFMAFEGLVQWTSAVALQADRVSNGRAELVSSITSNEFDFMAYRSAALAFHCECHFFVVSANKLLEHITWVRSLGLCSDVDFSGIDKFSARDIKDLRNMREHIIDYFQGRGRDFARWISSSPEGTSDASSVGGTSIGGRLDWVEFGAAAKALLKSLLSEPIPYPERPA